MNASKMIIASHIKKLFNFSEEKERKIALIKHLKLIGSPDIEDFISQKEAEQKECEIGCRISQVALQEILKVFFKVEVLTSVMFPITAGSLSLDIVDNNFEVTEVVYPQAVKFQQKFRKKIADQSV